MANKGLLLEADYPYTDVQVKCTTPAGKRYDHPQGSIEGASGDVTTMKSKLANGPLWAGLNTKSRYFLQYKNGIFNATRKECPQTEHNHVAAIVGFGNTYWIVKNDYGKTWGERGYVRMKIVPGDGVCGVQGKVGWSNF